MNGLCFCKVRLRDADRAPVRLKIVGGDSVRFTADQYIKIRGGDYDTYNGPYEVTPRLYQQTLATDNKVMRDDVSVFEIPITRTTNPDGGQTVLIG